MLAIALGVLAPTARAGELTSRGTTGQATVVERVYPLEVELLLAINQVRAARGLVPFKRSPGLRLAALEHSSEMARGGYFGHGSPGGMPFWQRIEWYYSSRGYRDWGVGENLEYGSPSVTAAETLHDWIASPPHRKNVFSRTWRDAGAGALFVTQAPGVFSGQPTVIVTLDVGLRRR